VRLLQVDRSRCTGITTSVHETQASHGQVMQNECIVANGDAWEWWSISDYVLQKTEDPPEWDSRALCPGPTHWQLESAYAEGSVYKQQEQYSLYTYRLQTICS
jgi:hypothetical protein